MDYAWARFLSLARSKLRLCSANHRAGYVSNLACDWLSIVWTYSEQETENGPCSVWINTKKGNIDKLQRAQNYAARIISDNSNHITTRSIDLLRSLRWAMVQERCDYFTAVLMYRSVHGLAPMYLTDNVVMAGEIHDRGTRLSHSNDVYIPPYNTDILKRSFIVNGGVIWNKLPDEIRMANDDLDFKWRYKQSILNHLWYPTKGTQNAWWALF